MKNKEKTTLTEALTKAKESGATVHTTDFSEALRAEQGDTAAACTLAVEYRHRAEAMRKAAEHARRHAVPFVGIVESYKDVRRLQYLGRAERNDGLAELAESLM